METNTETIGTAVGLIPSGCFILTVAHEGRQTGVLMSWVQQVSFEPVALSVCIKRGRTAQALVDGSGRFVLNVVGADPTPMFKHFGKGFALDEDAFDGVTTEHSEYGPILVACIGQLGCRVTQQIATGDHELYVAEVMAARAVGDAKPYVHLRKSGLSY